MFFNRLFFIVAVVIVLLDSVFLSQIKDYFAGQIQRVQGSAMKLDMYAAVICYGLLVIGIYYFIIIPKRSVLDAFLLGIVVYGVYETTNKALLANWAWKTVAIDTMWGGILFALTTYIIQLI